MTENKKDEFDGFAIPGVDENKDYSGSVVSREVSFESKDDDNDCGDACKI